jgi:hypothetical protein
MYKSLFRYSATTLNLISVILSKTNNNVNMEDMNAVGSPEPNKSNRERNNHAPARLKRDIRLQVTSL